MDVVVNGDCVTPEPRTDKGRLRPSRLVPSNGLSMACKGSQNLVWLPVDDPSGIAEYSVQVQRHSGNGNWQDAPGGGSGIQGKQTGVSVECGWTYRWRVSAVDGAGNEGGWSGWSEFSVLLG